jgi:hypothetical protein
MQNLFGLKVTWKGTLWQLFICLKRPPLRGYSNFVGSESDQITECKILVQYMLSNTAGVGEGVLNRRKCR